MERTESCLQLINNDVIENEKNFTRDDSPILTESTYEAIIQHFTIVDRPQRRQVMVFKEHKAPTAQHSFLLPEFSDVVLLVGREKVPVYGLQAILTCRSRVFFHEFLKLQKMDRSTSLPGTRKGTKRLRYLLPDYQPEVIKRLIHYLHTGKIQINSKLIVGLYCAAEEFELSELSEFCRQYISRGSWKQKISTIMDWIHFYGNKKGAQIILKKALAVLPKNTCSVKQTR